LTQAETLQPSPDIHLRATPAWYRADDEPVEINYL
jgi:hypothetical protein